MGSKLIITEADKLQERINNLMKGFDGGIGIYVSLNKTQKSLQEMFTKNNINTDKVFFIDCVASQRNSEEVLHLRPDDLDQLLSSITDFLDNIQGEKFLLIDALSTLLIYNTENKVAAFVAELTKKASSNTQIIAVSPKTKGEELLKKIFNFFDEVDNA